MNLNNCIVYDKYSLLDLGFEHFLGKRTNKKNKDYQIVKLELTGKCVTLDASYVLRQNISLNKKREQAKSYWNGEVKDDEKEVLFEGIAVVKEIICSNK